MSISRGLVGGLFGLALVFTPGVARSAPTQPPDAAASATPPASDAVASAVARFQRGQERYVDRDFAGALAEFRKAYEIAPNYRVFYNIGQVCYQMHDYVCAHESRERYLADGGSEIPAARRQAVERELIELQERIGYLDLQIDLPGAEVSVDDVLVGTAPLAHPVTVSAGRHRATVLAAGRAPFTRTVDVAGQDTAHVVVTLVAAVRVDAAPAAPAPAPAPAQPPTVASRGRSMTAYSWLGYGAGGAMLASAAVTGIIALNAGSDVRSKVYDDEAAANADKSRASSFALASDALLVGAVLTVAATTVLTFVLPRSTRARVGVGARGLDGGFSF